MGLKSIETSIVSIKCWFEQLLRCLEDLEGLTEEVGQVLPGFLVSGFDRFSRFSSVYNGLLSTSIGIGICTGIGDGDIIVLTNPTMKLPCYTCFGYTCAWESAMNLFLSTSIYLNLLCVHVSVCICLPESTLRLPLFGSACLNMFGCICPRESTLRLPLFGSICLNLSVSYLPESALVHLRICVDLL
ncbi:hypothetical protein Tco_0669762 [Tanacetum coccineum]